MPLPRDRQSIDVLTEGWPGDSVDYDLASFAARFRSDRPELSTPSLQRIGQRVEMELSRRERSSARVRTTRSANLRLGRFAPLAAAAALFLAAGTWLHFRSAASSGSPWPSRDNATSVPGVPVLHATPVTPASQPAVN